MLALTVLALVPRFMLGFLAIDLTWRSQTKSRLLELFMAGPVGVGISSLLSFLWIWLGLDLRLYAVAETTSILLVLVFLAWKHGGSVWQAWQSRRHAWTSHLLGWWVCLGAAVLMFSSQFWASSLQNSHGAWDAWTNWNVVARFVYRGGDRWQATFLRMYDHPDYPFMMAMTNATTWKLMQEETTRGPMVLAFLFTVCLVGVFFSVVRELRGTSQACLAAIVLLAQPLLVQNGVAQYADMPVACYFLASAGMTLLYVQSGERSLVFLAGLTAGLGAWTKNEGLAFAATSFMVWAYMSWRERSLVVRYYLLGAGGPLVLVGLFKAFLAPPNYLFSSNHGMFVSLVDPARYLVVLREAAMTFWRANGGLSSLLLVLIAYSCLIGLTRRRIPGLPYLTFIFGTQAFAYLVTYVVTPLDLAWQISTSLSRLCLHVFPLVLMALFLWLKSPDELNMSQGANGHVSRGLLGQQDT